MNKKRNKKSPCTCDSNLRYDQCCRKRDLAIKKARKLFTERKFRREAFVEKHGSIFEPEFIEAYGKNLIGVGGGIYDLGPNNLNGNFYTFIHEYALSFFGEDNLKRQYADSKENRHPALTWMLKYLDLRESQPDATVGAGRSWMRFAYDIYITHGYSELQEELKRRLQTPSKFQTARTELWAAALFIVAGFEIEYLTPHETTSPEFIATCKNTGFKLHVEAKCKQRKGLMNYRDGNDEPPGANIRLRSLIKKAVKKAQDLPLVAIIEASLPPINDKYNLDYWQKQLENTFTEIGGVDQEKPCGANLVLIYNDPTYYHQETLTSSDALAWSLDYSPVHTKNKASAFKDIRRRIINSVQQKNNIPQWIYDRSSE